WPLSSPPPASLLGRVRLAHSPTLSLSTGARRPPRYRTLRPSPGRCSPGLGVARSGTGRPLRVVIHQSIVPAHLVCSVGHVSLHHVEAQAVSHIVVVVVVLIAHPERHGIGAWKERELRHDYGHRPSLYIRKGKLIVLVGNMHHRYAGRGRQHAGKAK